MLGFVSVTPPTQKSMSAGAVHSLAPRSLAHIALRQVQEVRYDDRDRLKDVAVAQRLL